MDKLTKDNFNELYYKSGVWKKGRTKWVGHTILKNPCDLMIYQEIIYRNKPNLIIETGTCYGGTALFLSHMMDLAGIDGKVVTMDVSNIKTVKHKKMEFINASSTDTDTVHKVRNIAKKYDRVMVILDSDHSKNHVLKEMEIYGELVTTGQYMIVEDSNINGNPVRPDFGPGPMEAIDEYLKGNNDFEIDDNCEKFFLTFNPRGFLKKI